jgi:hypothetical protein
VLAQTVMPAVFPTAARLCDHRLEVLAVEAITMNNAAGRGGGKSATSGTLHVMVLPAHC